MSDESTPPGPAPSPSDPSGALRLLHGVGVSPGYAIGPAHLIDRRAFKIPKYHLLAEQVPGELARLDTALAESVAQIQHVKDRLQNEGKGQTLILDAHMLMLGDTMLVDRTRDLIRERLLNAEWALRKVVSGIKEIFDGIDDEYFRERRSDVDFVGERVIRNLTGAAHPSLSGVGEESIIVAHDLSPADTAFLLRTRVRGFVTDIGGKSSHTAIMARSLELPAVVGLERVTDQIGNGDLLIVDGAAGLVHINPSEEEVARYRHLAQSYRARRAQLDAGRHAPARTLDQVEIRVRGNIELEAETATVLGDGAEGVGLYRTEYLYMNRDALPNEEVQYQDYRSVLEQAGSAGATIRTLDLGGDKFITDLKLGRQMNPVMGLRAIRLCLREQGIFRTQLRALLRASVHGGLRVMVPLISSLEEVRATRAAFEACRADLHAEGQPVADEIPLGIMIEVPSAAVIADLLAREVDFFAIGTNDLIQYTLAIDRANEHVAHMYQPLHPALLRLLRTVIEAARAAGIGVSMCGEMAGEALYTPVLIGLGLDELSMTGVSIPTIKSVVRGLEASACRQLVEQIMTMDDGAAIAAHVMSRLAEWLSGVVPPEVFGAG